MEGFNLGWKILQFRKGSARNALKKGNFTDSFAIVLITGMIIGMSLSVLFDNAVLVIIGVLGVMANWVVKSYILHIMLGLFKHKVEFKNILRVTGYIPFIFWVLLLIYLNTQITAILLPIIMLYAVLANIFLIKDLSKCTMLESIASFLVYIIIAVLVLWQYAGQLLTQIY